MGTFEEIIRYVGIFGLGAILGILIKHFLDKDRERGSRVFNAKKESYVVVVSAISGFRLRVGKGTLIQTKSGVEKVIVSSPDDAMKQLANAWEASSTAKLFAGVDVEHLLKEFDNLTLEYIQVWESLDKFKRGRDHDKAISEFREISKKYGDFEEQLTVAMKKELSSG